MVPNKNIRFVKMCYIAMELLLKKSGINIEYTLQLDCMDYFLVIILLDIRHP